ncbi:MAG: hypothetical protein ACI3YK_02035 [Eubacteriales bacterium]
MKKILLLFLLACLMLVSCDEAVQGTPTETEKSVQVDISELQSMDNASLTDVCDQLFASERLLYADDLIEAEGATVINQELVLWCFDVDREVPYYASVQEREEAMFAVIQYRTTADIFFSNTNNFSDISKIGNEVIALKTEFEIDGNRYICYSMLKSYDPFIGEDTMDAVYTDEDSVVFRLEDKTHGIISYDRDRFPSSDEPASFPLQRPDT